MDGAEARAARLLVEHQHDVVRAHDREAWRRMQRRLSGGRLGRRRPWPASQPEIGAGWRDSASTNRRGWRERAALVDGEVVFSVDYEYCELCGLGWVEEPHTDPPYQRHGLARAGLAAVRRDHPGLRWHTLGGHSADARPFWSAAATDVPGGYEPRPVCRHVTLGG